MKTKFKKFLGYFPPAVLAHYEMLFSSAADNHLKIVETGQKKFRSFTELKRHQKRVRRYVAIFLLAVFSWLLGILVAPIYFPKPAESEVYIPNGKGDIVLGNVSKNQATVIFKTLDSANGNKPLATKATVEVYEDQNYTNLARRTNEDDYAVTHIIPVDSLQEGKTYYIRIIAKDAANPVHTKVVSAWGDGNEPITVYTSGELVSNCATQGAAQPSAAPAQNADSNIDTPAVKTSEGAPIADNVEMDSGQVDNSALNISEVQNENHLEPGNMVQTLISWFTNIPASTSITYWEENSGEKKQLDVSDQLATKHGAVMTTLKAGATYYFTVESKDASGNVVTSDEYSLLTPRPEENVIQKISDNFNALLHQIKP